jgi:hypothetical protein
MHDNSALFGIERWILQYSKEEPWSTIQVAFSPKTSGTKILEKSRTIKSGKTSADDIRFSATAGQSVDTGRKEKDFIVLAKL